MKTTSPLAIALTIVALVQASASEPPAAAPAASSLVVACKWADSVAFYDDATGKLQNSLPIGSRPHEMALSKDGKLAFVTLYGTDFYYDNAEGGGGDPGSGESPQAGRDRSG